jgi:hypothetical protein
MTETFDDQPEHRVLLRQLKGAYVSSSLTILSIIQGVALAALAAAVSGSYARFTLAQWIMALVTFGVLVVVWNQITIDTMSWVQVPDFQGALVPFLVGALELFLAAAITLNVTLWLGGNAVLVVVSSVGLLQVSRLAAREPENAKLLARVRGMRNNAHVYNTVGVVLFVALAVSSQSGEFHTIDTAIGVSGAAAALATLIPGLWLVGWLLRSFWYWRKIVTFARTGT